MKDIYNTYRPDGFSTISSYLMVSDPAKLIDFFKGALMAQEKHRTEDESGVIRNCILQIGSSCLMVAQAGRPEEASKTSHYLFVDDVDIMYQRCLKNGAESIFPPDDMPYGDRQAGVKDPAGNSWWISKRLEENPY